jgi:hypothetical protein
MFSHGFTGRDMLRMVVGSYLQPKFAGGAFGHNDNPWVDLRGNPSWGEQSGCERSLSHPIFHLEFIPDPAESLIPQ